MAEDTEGREVPVTESDEFRTALAEALEREKAEIKAALAKANEEAKKHRLEARELRSKLPENFDPDEYQALLEEREARQKEEHEKKGEYEKVIAQVTEKLELKVAKERDAKAAVERQLDELLRTNAARQALERDFHVEAALPHAERYIRVEADADGKRNVVISHPDGSPIIGEGGEQVTQMAGLIEWMKTQDVYQPLIKPSGATGGGAPAGGQSARGGNKDRGKMEIADKVEFIDKHGIDAYLALPS